MGPKYYRQPTRSLVTCQRAARPLACNLGRMNSWHSWSPDGRWLVFASKQHSDYTQLYLAREALRLVPDYAEVHYNFGALLLSAERMTEAEGHFTEAVRLRPELAGAHNCLGIIR